MQLQGRGITLNVFDVVSATIIGGLVGPLTGMAPVPLWIGEVTFMILSFGKHSARFCFPEEELNKTFFPLQYPSYWIGIVILVLLGFWLKET